MLAGDGAQMLSPKKKKRQKHQDTPSQAGPSTLLAEAPAAPASNAQHRTANSPAVNGLAYGAAAHSPAVAQAAATSTPTADQIAASGPPAQQPSAVIQNGVADSQQGTVSLWCSLQHNITVEQEPVTHDISSGLSRYAHTTNVTEPELMLCKTVHLHASVECVDRQIACSVSVSCRQCLGTVCLQAMA